jgi:hypothetical protein
MSFFLPRFRRWALLGCVLMGLSACVESFEPGLTLTADVLIVDGTITDLPERQTVRLSRSRVANGQSYTAPVTGATVEILVNGNNPVGLRENAGTKGLYEAPVDFRGQVGNRYQLRFTTAEGQRYQSSEEMLAGVPAITKVYDQFDAQGIVNAEKTAFTPANLIYIDTQDPGSSRNYYRWTWTLWEQQGWCATCTQGLYIATTALGDGYCQTSRSLPPGNLYDYACAGACWEIIRGIELSLFSDAFSNGRPITGKLVAKIPYYQAGGALIEVRQQALGLEAYRYYQLFQNQTQNTGGLADTPPAPLVGNVRNLANDRENVAGYFAAAGVSRARYWMSRQNNSGRPLGLYEGLFQRPPNPEPSAPFRPPSARCALSDTRTPIRPDGWQ